MPKHFDLEIEKLKKKTLYLSAIVEEVVQKAFKAFEERNTNVAKEIIEGDIEIDRIEVDLEEDCLKVLALYQPVASDLRYITSIIKINNELERIGDLATNISKTTITLSMVEKLDFQLDFKQMANKTRDMLRLSLDSLMKMDVKLAYTVISTDDEVDSMKRRIIDLIKNEIKRDPDKVDTLLYLLSVPRFLERIGDHATNIAENIIYVLEGEIIRHRFDNTKPE